MWLQIHISRSTVNVSASRGTPPSTLSVKGQIETVRVKGTVDNSARLQWLASDSSVVVFFFFHHELREPRRQSFYGRLQSRKQQMQPSVHVIYPCPVCFYTQSWLGFAVEPLKTDVQTVRVARVESSLAYGSFNSNCLFCLPFFFHRHRKLNL